MSPFSKWINYTLSYCDAFRCYRWPYEEHPTVFKFLSECLAVANEIVLAFDVSAWCESIQ